MLAIAQSRPSQLCSRGCPLPPASFSDHPVIYDVVVQGLACCLGVSMRRICRMAFLGLVLIRRARVQLTFGRSQVATEWQIHRTAPRGTLARGRGTEGWMRRYRDWLEYDRQSRRNIDRQSVTVALKLQDQLPRKQSGMCLLTPFESLNDITPYCHMVCTQQNRSNCS